MNKLANKVLAIGLISTLLTFSIGCNSAQALIEVQRFEPVLVNVLVLACTINSGLPVCGTMQATIKSDADLVIKLWSDYNAAVKAGTSTTAIWNELNAAFVVFEQDSAAIFAAGLGLNAPEVTAIIAAAQILLSTIEALFPAAPVGTTAARPERFRKYTATLGTPRSYDKRWLEAWAKDYNQKVDVAQKLHPKANLQKVYVHSVVAHVATLGIAK